MNNEFVVIPGHPQYEINKRGQVRNKITQLYRKISINHYGYQCVVLRYVGGRKTKTYLIHRLLGILFIPNPRNSPFINHKNGIKYDNRLENLEWCTRAENMAHAAQTGLMATGERYPQSKLTIGKVVEIKSLLKNKISQTEIARKFNVSQNTISEIKRGKKWKHVKDT